MSHCGACGARSDAEERIRELEAALVAYDPPMPARITGETDDEYTDRLTGAFSPYTERRNRQCSIGWHDECSDSDVPKNERVCQCPCHDFEELREKALGR